MSAKAPKTVAYLRTLANLKQVKGWSRSQLLGQINAKLSGEKLPDTRATHNILTRWLAVDHPKWQEPRSEIILAIQEVLADN